VALARARYLVAGLDIADLGETEELVEAAGSELLPVRCDVRDPESVDAAVAAVVREFGALHVVVNNAGVYPQIPFEQTTLEDWWRIMRVNLDGPFLLTKAALPHLRAAGWGRIVNIVSAVVFLGPPELVAYTTSKAGLVGFTRALATELGPANITVNAIAPGLTHTATAARTTGATLLYVCDKGSGFLTGQTINVDGGSAKH
jgi:NAD(P)-dependent dehydrogenase (short-subunit alcohol dehydrogenase family)